MSLLCLFSKICSKPTLASTRPSKTSHNFSSLPANVDNIAPKLHIVHWKTTPDRGIVGLKPPLPLLTSQANNLHHNKHHIVATFVDENTPAKNVQSILARNGNEDDVGDVHVVVYEGRKFGRAQQFVSSVRRRLREQFFLEMAKEEMIRNMDDLSVGEQWKYYRKQKEIEADQLNRILIQVQSNHQLSNNFLGETDAKKSKQNRTRWSTKSNTSKGRKSNKIDTYIQTILQRVNGNQIGSYLVPIREISSRIGADQWYEKGVPVHLLDGCGDGKIHPHYNVYPPTRQEYLNLLCVPDDTNPLVQNNNSTVVMDVGCGTGILSAILLHRHKNASAILTDISPLAVDCASDNLTRLGLMDRVRGIHLTDQLLADAEADLIVCNPPWIPGKVANQSVECGNWLEKAIYDDVNSTMLFGFLRGVSRHMRINHSAKTGDRQSESWLIISDLAERLQLRSREELLQTIDDGGLEITEVRKAVPTVAQRKRVEHVKRRRKEVIFPKVEAARQAEVTYLFRLRRQR
mmetsp:Transcript_22933/g.45837  ORF Transcript_22933/g.45837 Transcript_22933/m.45837 type:complete len:518 (-) Transcript_22933:149-1702(-)